MKPETMAKMVVGSTIYGVPGICAFLSLVGIRGTLVDLCSTWFVIAMAMTVFVYVILSWSERNKPGR